MSTKTVISENQTLHIPGPDFNPPLRLDVVATPPGTPVEIEEEEADRLIALGVAQPWPPVVEAPPTLSAAEAERIERTIAASLAYTRAVEALAKEAAAKDQEDVEQ